LRIHSTQEHLDMKKTIKAVLPSLVVVAAVALASNVTLPFTFTAGTTARAADVNANFTAVKTAVDDNFSRITALQTQPAYTAPTFLTGWSSVSGAYAPAGYFKDTLGFVHLRGVIRKASAASPNNVFTLPTGFRPSGLLNYGVRCGDDTMCAIQVYPNGTVEFLGGNAGAVLSVSLEGIIIDPR
jgi:hypothetical protein